MKLNVFFVPYAWQQFWADLHEIWHMASLYPTDGHREVEVLASATQDHGSMRSLYMTLEMSGVLRQAIQQP